MSYEFLHVRKRKKEDHVEERGEERSPVLKRGLDRVAYIVALIVPLSSLDQMFRIWQAKSSAGVSMLVWTMLLITSIFWIFYGAIHREKVIFFGHIVWFIISSIILFEIIIFS